MSDEESVWWSPARGRTLAWHWCKTGLLCLLILLLLDWRARILVQDTIAPIQLERETRGCMISSSGRYVAADGMFDLTTGKELALMQQVGYQDNDGPFFLIPGDRMFKITQKEKAEDSHGSYERILDGVVLDLALGSKRTLAQLSVQDQKSILESATQAYRYPLQSERDQKRSPNRAYLFTDKHIYAVDPTLADLPADPPGPPLVVWSGSASLCVNAWAPDSRGVYFISESTRLIPDFNSLSFWGVPLQGPIRLLLVHPPFPIWAWVVRGVALLLVAVLLLRAWRRRPQG